MNRAVRYALGLMVEEMGEALCHIGRALRFGMETEGGDGVTEHCGLTRELGDVKASIDFASSVGMVSGGSIQIRSHEKLLKLLDPAATDNLGRRLAPAPIDFLASDNE